MTATVRFGRLRGIPIGAHWSVLVILILVADMLAESILPATVKGASGSAYWLVGALVAVAFLLSLVAHEAAHAIVAQRVGMGVKTITLWMLGGVTELDGEAPDARSELRIAIVGPAVSLACAGLSAVAALLLDVIAAPRVLEAGFVWLAVTNGLLAVFNLLPGAPLDGGRVLRALLWRRTGDPYRAALTAARGGRATGFVLLWLGIAETLATADLISGVWLMLIGWFLVSAASAEQQAAVSSHTLAGLSVSDVMHSPVMSLPTYLGVLPAAKRAVDADEEYVSVCDLDGRPVGVVSTDQLVRASRETRTDRTVKDIASPITRNMTARPDDLLVPALNRAGRRSVIAVVDDDRIVGIVTPAQVNRALRRGLVHAGP